MKVFILHYTREEREEEMSVYLNKKTAIKQMESEYLKEINSYYVFIFYSNIDTLSTEPFANITYSDYSHTYWKIIEKEVIE